VHITLNGEPSEVKSRTLAELLEELRLTEARVAVELNRTLVRRAQLDETPLTENDTVEIVSFVGGG